MKVDFANLDDAVISLEDFRLKWRFTDSKYGLLAEEHLNQLKPLNAEASKFLNNHINQLHNDFPFTNQLFKIIEKIDILNVDEVRKWLYKRSLPFQKNVFLIWDEETTMVVPCKLLIKYFDDFFYPGSDDLTVVDQNLSWALLFFHEDEIYFGTNENYTI